MCVHDIIWTGTMFCYIIRGDKSIDSTYYYLLTMGIIMESGHHYTRSGTYCIGNRQDEHLIEEIVFICLNKENCHISTPTFVDIL